MLNFDFIHILDKHQKFLQKKCKTENIFLVWWSVRDLILDINKKPTDIDFTMSWKPVDIYEKIDKKDLSHFITEKFGTITLIPKHKKVQYELTPLRTENEYSDNRHPEKINRQDDILLDSNRRDFSINCIYYFSTKISKISIWHRNLKKKNIYDLDQVQDSLKKHKILFYQDQNLLIIQDHKIISKLFPKSQFNSDFAIYLLDIIKEVFSHKKQFAQDTIRIIVDPHMWIQDLAKKKIKCVWDPDKRFTEDALRIIRALRFVSVLNQKLKDNSKKNQKIQLFDVDTETRSALKSHKDLVQNVAKERIKDEVQKTFVSGDPFSLISLLQEVWLLSYIFPALSETMGVDQPVRYHPFDTYAHTILTLYELQKINKDYLVRFAMLYHDVWKVEQYAAYDKSLDRGEIREILAWPLNHRNSGPELAKKDLANLWFSKNEIKDISRYIAKHHVPGEILDAKPENRSKKLRKLYSEAWFEKVNSLLDIAIADRLGQYNPMQNSSDITDVEDLRKILKNLKKKEWQFTSKDLKVDWKIIMEYFQIPPSSKVWDLLNQAMERVLSDVKTRNNKEKILKYLKWYIKQ